MQFRLGHKLQMNFHKWLVPSKEKSLLFETKKVFLASRHSSKSLQFFGNESGFTVKAWSVYSPWDCNWLLLSDAVSCLDVLINIASYGKFFSAPSDTAEFTLQ